MPPQRLRPATQKILAEFPGIEGHLPLPFRLGGEATGVQDPYSKLNGAAALEAHGVYRCSVSVFALNLLSSPTPDIPTSTKRVHDMTTFFYSDPPDTPSMLQMISPEEIVHAMIFGCAEAIGRHGCKMTVLPS